MKCYLLLLYSTQKPYCYSMVRYLIMLIYGNMNETKLSILTRYCGFAAS